MRARKGRFKVKNPEKYIGDADNITYRSLLERTCMSFFDSNPNVLKWNSEQVVVPYISPIDNKAHRYYIDFYVEYLGKDGEIKRELIEVKPASQTKPPKKKSGKRQKTYMYELATYMINQAKWKAAQKYAEKNNLVFKLLTENEIRKGKSNK